ncbi:hypothetical protein COU76_00370 [Candidatus Peregrinibacteria bacterium CG10_big_fil_rev_8_21_14_0_10_49_10]|nr:MAG: hypothetical protein COU76_00370 [Candidatus Peregrinibacteria bacterium CG10_big_fil_rev_8_21_14_0_10_49_10]
MRKSILGMICFFVSGGLLSAQTTSRTDVREAVIVRHNGLKDEPVGPYRQFMSSTTGTHSPSVTTIVHHNVNSDVHVVVMPLDGAVAMKLFDRDAELTDRLIDEARNRRFAEGQLVIEQSVPRTINVTATATATAYGGGQAESQGQQPECTTKIPVRCWSRCGSYFIDGSGHRWNYSSGPKTKGSGSLVGTMNGNRFLTEGGTTYIR